MRTIISPLSHPHPPAYERSMRGPRSNGRKSDRETTAPCVRMCLDIAARGARKAARKGKTKTRASTTGTVTCGAAHARLEDSLSLGLGDTRTVICHRVGD